MIEFSPAVLAKAEKAKRNAAQPDAEEAPTVWSVPSLNGPTEYRVQHAEMYRGEVDWITCSCAHGRKAGGGAAHCYHAAAVLLLIKEGQS